MESLSDTFAVVGRILISIIFVKGGIQKLISPAATAAYMEHSGMTVGVMPLLYISALIELIGGILIILGLRTRLVAFLVFLYLIPVTIIIHALPGGPMNVGQVYKNLAVMGGLLMVAAHGAGALSIDRV